MMNQAEAQNELTNLFQSLQAGERFPVIKEEKRNYVRTVPFLLGQWGTVAGFCLLILNGFHIRYADIWGLMSLQDAITVHNYCGFAAIVNSIFWLLYYLGVSK